MTISIANKYFNYWSSKNLEALDEIIHSDCILEDWQTKIYGKAEIKNFNETTGNSLVIEDVKIQISCVMISNIIGFL